MKISELLDWKIKIDEKYEFDFMFNKKTEY